MSHKKVTFEKKKPYLINIEYNNTTGINNIFKEFDYTFLNSMYTVTENNIPIIYESLYKFIDKKNDKDIIVTYSPDVTVSVSTVNAMNSKFPDNSLKILLFTSTSRINTIFDKLDKTKIVFNYSNTLISSILGELEEPFFSNTTNILPEQIFIIGVNENHISEKNNEELKEIFGDNYISFNNIRSNDIKKIFNSFITDQKHRPTHVIFDLSVAKFNLTPTSIRTLNKKKIKNLDDIDGFDINELNYIFDELSKLNIVALDITNYITEKKCNEDDRAIKVTCEIARLPMKKIFGLKEYSFNVYNEFSKFLIFRPLKKVDEDDVGWYILRDVQDKYSVNIFNTNMKNKIINEIEDNIILFDPNNPLILDDVYDSRNIIINTKNSKNTVYITTTSIDEQNKKIFIGGITKINDKTLYPGEKSRMLFEML